MSRKYENLLALLRGRDAVLFARAVSVLPERNRDIVLSALRGETQSETAVRLDMKQPNVSRTLRSSIEAISVGMGSIR